MSQLNLDKITLDYGAHYKREDGVCLMEAVAWFAGEPHSDTPACVSPLLASLGIVINDMLDDDQRQQLKPLIPLLVGTAGDQRKTHREHLIDSRMDEYADTWLRATGLSETARRVAADVQELAGKRDGPESQLVAQILGDVDRKVWCAWEVAGGGRGVEADWSITLFSVRHIVWRYEAVAARRVVDQVIAELQQKMISLYESMTKVGEVR